MGTSLRTQSEGTSRVTGGKRRVNGRTGPTVPTPGKGTPGPEDPEPRREPAPGPEPRPHPRASGRHRGHGPHPGSCRERACQVPPPPVEGRGGLPTPTPAWTPTQHESNASHDQTLPDAQASPKSASWPRRGSAKQPRHGETAPKRQGGTGAGLQGPSGVDRRPPNGGHCTGHTKQTDSHVAGSRGDKSGTTAPGEPSTKGNLLILRKRAMCGTWATAASSSSVPVTPRASAPGPTARAQPGWGWQGAPSSSAIVGSQQMAWALNIGGGPGSTQLTVAQAGRQQLPLGG